MYLVYDIYNDVPKKKKFDCISSSSMMTEYY